VGVIVNVAHVKGDLPAGGKDLETRVLERVEILDQIARDGTLVKPHWWGVMPRRRPVCAPGIAMVSHSASDRFAMLAEHAQRSRVPDPQRTSV